MREVVAEAGEAKEADAEAGDDHECHDGKVCSCNGRLGPLGLEL